MECHIDEGEGIGQASNTEILAPGDDCDNLENTVTTIYYSCGSKAFDSSRSSVHVLRDCKCNVSGIAQPNFCDLDIVSKREKVKTIADFIPLQTISEELKCLPMTDKIVGGRGIFRKTVSKKLKKEMDGKSSEVLCLETVLKEGGENNLTSTDVSAITNKFERNKHKHISVEEENKTEKSRGKEKAKRSSSKSKKLKEIKSSEYSFHDPNFITNQEVAQHFGDLINAKTMYYDDLPNKCEGQNVAENESEIKEKDPDNPHTAKTANTESSKDKKRSRKVSAGSKKSEEQLLKEIKQSNSKVESIIINRIESDVQQVYSADSDSTIVAKDKNNFEITIDVFGYTGKNSNYRRIHNNSPIDDAAAEGNVDPVDKLLYTKKRKKRHTNSRKYSSEDEDKSQVVSTKSKNKTKAEIKEKELKVPHNVDRVKEEPLSKALKKKNHSKRREHKKEEDTTQMTPEIQTQNMSRESVSNGNGEGRNCDVEIKKSATSAKAEREKEQLKTGAVNNDAIVTAEVVDSKSKKRHKRRNERLPKTIIVKQREESVTSICVARKLAPSVSSIRIEDQFILNLSTPAKKDRSRSGTSSNRRQNSPVVTKNQSIEGDASSNCKQVRKKKRSKSRAYKEERNITRTRHAGPEQVIRQISRTSVSDLFEGLRLDNFDACASSDGKSNDRRRKTTSPSSGDKKEKNRERTKYPGYIVPSHVAERLARKSNISSPVVRRSKISLNTSEMTWEESHSRYSTKGTTVTKDVASGLEVKSSISKFLSEFQEQVTFSVHKEKWRRSKSCAPQEAHVPQAPAEDTTLITSTLHVYSSSETSIVKRLPTSKRSKSLFVRERHKTSRVSDFPHTSKEKLHEELRKLGEYQDVDPMRKRFRAVPKTTEYNDISSTVLGESVEEILPPNMQSLGSHRLKPRVCSEKEKEAILSLPIFKSSTKDGLAVSLVREADRNNSGAALDGSEKTKKKSKKRETKRENEDSDLPEDVSCRSRSEKVPRRRKRTRKPAFRREVSFSHLNVVPLCELYSKPSKISLPQQQPSPDVAAAAKFEKLNTVLGKGFAHKLEKRRIKQQLNQQISNENKHSERSCDDTDYSLEMKAFSRKLSSFHISSDEKIIEISTKAIGDDGNTIVGYTVSGSEPPKRMRYANKNVDKSICAKTCKLHMTFLPPIELNEETSNFEKKILVLNYAAKEAKECSKKTEYYELIPPQTNVDQDGIKATESLRNCVKAVKSTRSKSRKASVLFEHRRKARPRAFGKDNFRKNVIAFGSLCNPEISSIKTCLETAPKSTVQENKSPVTVMPIGKDEKKEFHSEKSKFEVTTEKSAKNRRKPRYSQQKQDNGNKNRINHTIKLLESTLQIIKEESQSTDTSFRCEKSTSKEKLNQVDMKNTQTDLQDRDIVKMKEVINYLYNTMDQKNTISKPDSKVLVKKAENDLQTVDSSSTETSSYCDQFKNMVKNVRPKFCHVKKTLRSRSSSKNNSKESVPDSSNQQSYQKKEQKNLTGTRRVSEPSIVSGISVVDTSSGEKSTTTSDSKSSARSKSLRGRYSSSDVLSTGYFEKYKSTKELIDWKKRSRMQTEESLPSKCDKAMLTDPRSSSSTSELSNGIIISEENIAARKKSGVKSSKEKVQTVTTAEKCVQCTPTRVRGKSKEEVIREAESRNSDATKTSSKSSKIPITKDVDLSKQSFRNFYSQETCAIGSNASSKRPSRLLVRHVKVQTTNSEITKPKLLEEKSLQTSDFIGLLPINQVNEIYKSQATENFDGPKKIGAHSEDLLKNLSDKKLTEESITQRYSSNSSNSFNKAIIEKIANQAKSTPGQLNKRESYEKTSRKLDRLRKVFRSKEEKFPKNEIMAFNVLGKHERRSLPQKHCLEADYVNFIKLERHLEKVLGLYPLIFKAIRAQVDNTVANNIDNDMKTENSELFASKSTLATTIDTITEYKNIERCERIPYLSDGNVSKDCSSHCCHCYHFRRNKYIFEQHMKSQDISSGLKKDFTNEKYKLQTGENGRKVHRKKLGRTRQNSGITCTDTTSSFKESMRKLRDVPKRFKKEKRKENNEVNDELNSVTSMFSNEKGFTSSCSSGSFDQKWSVASPLYGRTTSSLDLSSRYDILEGYTSKSSRSLATNNNKMLVLPKKPKSKSLIEISSKKNVNRKLTMQHLLNFTENKQLPGNIMQVFSEEAQPNVLLLSVSSSCTVFTTPSKFLAKVERHLQFDQSLKHLPDTSTKAVGSDPVDGESTKGGACGGSDKVKIDEQSYHSILFPDKSNRVKFSRVVGGERQKPFYIHKQCDSCSDLEFLDSLEVDINQTSCQEESRIGDDDFSADSLETVNCRRPQSACDYNMLFTGNMHMQPRNQTYLVYSNTVKYDKSSGKQSARSKHSGNQQNTCPKTRTTSDNPSNTLISESGYESTKSKRTASIRNFFKKGGSLLDMFRNSPKNCCRIQKNETQESSTSNLTSFSSLFMKKQAQQKAEMKDAGTSLTKEKSSATEDADKHTKVYWFNMNKQETDGKNAKTDKKTSSQRSASSDKKDKKVKTKNKCTGIKLFHKCSCTDTLNSYKKQMNECHEYAEKVILESQLRKEGYYKQYKEFKEIPLELLIGKRMPSSKYKAPTAIQTQITSRREQPPSTDSNAYDSDARSWPRTFKTDEKITLKGYESAEYSDEDFHRDKSVQQHVSKGHHGKTSPRTSKRSPRLAVPSPRTSGHYRKIVQPNKSSPYMTDEELPVASSSLSLEELKFLLNSQGNDAHSRSHPGEEHNEHKSAVTPKNSISFADDSEVTEIFTSKPKPKSRSNSKSGSKTMSTAKPKPKSEKEKVNCHCDQDVEPVKAKPKKKKVDKLKKKIEGKTNAEAKEQPSEEVEEIVESPKELSKVQFEEELEEAPKDSGFGYEDVFDMTEILDEIVSDAVDEVHRVEDVLSGLEYAEVKSLSEDFIQLRSRSDQDTLARQQPTTEVGIKPQTSDDIRQGLTDKEVFDKLLDSFERVEDIAVRLSKDEEFFKAQIDSMKKESDESLEEEKDHTKDETDPNAVIYTEDPIGGKHRSTHFWEEKMKMMRAKEDNPVKTDDIGTCFSRGFRPDNIALSGDACFNLNKQDRLKFPKGMLTDEESIIDFSERETPLDYLLALGFMVDEASNALKDEDIRSRLLAAITEARVWINKITTTQGTLLYLVAYKSRPKTMRYFLQLVEAIINKRINNAIKLDGFLRVLEQVEEGEIQMINILGADKFEDEENEEKIVRKQLRQLFVTVYKIAERESLQRGKSLSQQAIVLLRILAAKYRAGLHPHLELIARYIGQELLNTETQLEAAMIFLSRLDTAEVKLKEFEAYCDIKCEKKKKKYPINLKPGAS